MEYFRLIQISEKLWKRMTIISTDTAEKYQWGKGAYGWHLLKSPELSVIEETVPPNESEERHYHERAQQFFYILSGIAYLEVDGLPNIVTAGNGCHVPANTPHQLKNIGDEILRFLVISQPMSHGDRVTL